MAEKRRDSQLEFLARRALAFGALVVILDFLVGSGLAWLHANQKRGVLYRAVYGLEQTRADLLIFGSSSANHHFVPQIIGAGLDMSVYNLGKDSMEVLYAKAFLMGVLKRYAPKAVLLNLTPSELSAVDNYDKLSVLLPYYRKHPEMRDVICLRSPHERLKLLSRIYPYNSMVVSLLAGAIGHASGRPESGYVPLHRRMEARKTSWITFKEEPVLDPRRVAALESFILSCKERGIALAIVFSPWFYVRSETTATIAMATRLGRRHGVPVFNHIVNPEFLGNAGLFADEGHLNHEGASLFSRIIVKEFGCHLGKDEGNTSR